MFIAKYFLSHKTKEKSPPPLDLAQLLLKKKSGFGVSEQMYDQRNKQYLNLQHCKKKTETAFALK